MFRANLGTDTTARTQDRIDVNPVLLDKKGGTCQVVDAISVSFTLFTDEKRFPPGSFQGFAKQCAWFLGNNYRNPFIHQCFLDGFNALFHPVPFPWILSVPSHFFKGDLLLQRDARIGL